MKKLYVITYALLIAGVSLYAQNAKNINQDTGKPVETIKPTAPENRVTTPTAGAPTTTMSQEDPKPKALTAATPETPKAMPSQAATSEAKTPTPEVRTTAAPEGTIETIVSPEVKEHKMVTIGLDADTRQNIASILHKLLANEYALYAKTQKYHWNVQGKFFGPLHTLFQKQYEMLAEIIDQVGERSLALGIPSIGGLKELTNLATIAEETNENINDMAMITQLLTDHEMIIKHLRTGIDTTAKLNDMGTNNLLSDIITKHEKIAWMLRAHLQ